MRDPRIDPRPNDILLRRFTGRKPEPYPEVYTVTERNLRQFDVDEVVYMSCIGEQKVTIANWRVMVENSEVLYVVAE